MIIFEKSTKQLRQTFSFFISSYIIYFTLLINYITYSYTSRTIASSQHHPRETRPLLSQSNLYKNCYIGFTYYEFVSYIRRNASIFLPYSFFFIQLFLFLSFIFIYNIKLKSIKYLFIYFLLFSYFFFYPLFSYII